MKIQPAIQQPLPRHYFIMLGFAWLLLQSLLLLHFGIVTGFESGKYIEQADHLLATGTYTSSNFLFYSTQILLLAAVKKLHIGYVPVVLLQLALNAVSVGCFFKIIQLFTAKSKAAFWFTLAFLAMYYYQAYNVYLFTESLYFSFSIIYFYGLLRISRLRLYTISLLLPAITLLYFTRPVGIFFLPATFVYFVYKFFPRKFLLIFSTAGLLFLICFTWLLNTSLGSGGELDFLLPYTKEMIICGVPTISNSHPITVPVQQNSVQGLLYIIIHYPGFFFALGLKRMMAFWGVVRSYYSLSHNIFIAVYFYSLYLLVGAGVRNWVKEMRPAIAFVLCLVFFTTVSVVLSCDEWHNRFMFTIMPFLLMMASLAFKSSKTKEFQH
jgi:hypothetical protein